MRFGLSYPLRDTNDPGGAGVDPPATPAEPVTFGEDIIPEELRGRPPEEIKLLLSQMPRIVKAQKDEIDRLKTTPAAAPVVAEPVTPAEPAQNFEELMENDPKAAMRQFVEEEYGSRIVGIEAQVGEGEFSRVAAKVPGFGEHAESVRVLLAESGTAPTEANILGAYAMARGQAEIMREAQLRRDATSTIPATPAPDDPQAVAPLNAIEAEVAGHMGLDAAEFRKYSDPDSLQLKIRT